MGPLASPPPPPGRLYAQSVRIITANQRPVWPGLRDRPTSHAFWAMYLAPHGGLRFVRDDGSEHAVGACRITVIPPYLAFRHRFPDGCRHAYVLFDLPHVPPQVALSACGGNILELDDAVVVSAMQAFSRDAEVGLPPLERALRGQLVATQGLLALLRILPLPRRNLILDPTTSAGRLQPAIDWIEAHLDQPIAVADLAKAVGCGEDHCGRLFRSILGRSPVDYIIQRRIDRAGLLLADQHLGLDAVAQACGLGTRRYLGRLFRRSFGVSPSVYRARLAASGAA